MLLSEHIIHMPYWVLDTLLYDNFLAHLGEIAWQYHFWSYCTYFQVVVADLCYACSLDNVVPSKRCWEVLVDYVM